MEIKGDIDLIKDEYSNYYVAVKEVNSKESNEITLVNYFIRASFSVFIRTALEENEKDNCEFPDLEFIGKLPMKRLKSRVEDIEKGKDTIAKIIPMEEVKQAYDIVKIIPFYEKQAGENRT